MATPSYRLIPDGENRDTPDPAGAGSLSGRVGDGVVVFLQWEFAESFTAVEAALLIEGKNPSDCRPDGKDGFGNMIVSEVILSRMQLDYDETHMGYALDSLDIWPPKLPSVMMNQFTRNLNLSNEQARFKKWLLNNESSNFYEQIFDRKDLQSWLFANQLPSEYQFKQCQPGAVETRTGRWPWGNHHTELLGHLEAAASRYWVNYDPTDSTTAPTNKDVAEWLVDKRNVSQKMAESIASMLRPDGLPTGPRK